MKKRIFPACVFACILLLSSLTWAFPSASVPMPLAVRWWGQSMVSIETFWNLTVVIDPYNLKLGAYDDPQLAGDLVLVTHEHFDHNNVEMVRGEHVVLRGLDKDGKVQMFHKVLDRLPNQDRPAVVDFNPQATSTENALVVKSIASHHDDQQGAQRGHNAMFLIETCGVRLLHAGDLGQPQLSDEQVEQIGRLDLLLLPVGGVYTIDAEQALTIIHQLRPRYVIPLHFGVPELAVDLSPRDDFLKLLPKSLQKKTVPGNTLALSAYRRRDIPSPQVVLMQPRPWTMPDELKTLFRQKEQAARSCVPVYQSLSVNQMNHRPANGTHTPRWNVEHICGRELGFFTQIFAGVDPEMSHIDLNPQQMPTDYVAAHPDWSGSEEARQIERTQAFTRRFAYLLDGLDLNTKPDGSFWILNRLFRQMARHYPEHTDNVKEKFLLPDWPKE